MQTNNPNFNYLGTPQLTRQQMGPEITERIRCARQWCQRHWNLLCNPVLHSRSKFHLYKTFVRPILTYGCEVWNLNQCESKRLLRFESGILIEIYKSKYPPRHPKRLKPRLVNVYKRFRGTDVVYHVNCERLQWATLLEKEENALRRTQKRCMTSVHWWDRPCKHSRKPSKVRQSTIQTKEIDQTEKSSKEDSKPNPSVSKTKDVNTSLDQDKPSTSKQPDVTHEKKIDEDPG